jgi:hypothetical protein
MAGFISIHGSDELKAIVLSLKAMDGTLRKQIYKETRSKLVPAWTEALATKASTSPERLTLVVGSSNKKLSGGGTTTQIAAAVEFGAPARQAKITNRKGTTYQRVINRQFKARKKTGYVTYPSAAEIAPRAAALYVQTSVRAMHEAFEGKS